ncbi:MAG: hypothetical protein VW239_02060, partial [Candidatus Nanopelagicales bacterium]
EVVTDLDGISKEDLFENLLNEIELSTRLRTQLHQAEQRAEAAEGECERLRELTGSFCYCGIGNDACDGWKNGLCDLAGTLAPDGSVDKLRARLESAEAVVRRRRGRVKT